MKEPNAVELQRALTETTRCLKRLTVERYETRYGDKEPKGCCYDAVDAAEKLLADLPPVPEPIKVGDRVRWGRYPDGGDEREGVVLAGPWRERFTGADIVATSDPDAGIIELVAVGQLTRVGSSPSPGPERCDGTCYNDPANQCTEEWHRSNRLAMASNGSEGGDPSPAPSPSPEVGEGWRVPVDMAEADAAYRAEVIQYDDAGRWWSAEDLSLPSSVSDPLTAYRVPSGWGGAS